MRRRTDIPQTATNVRWWVAGPGEDESLRSMVERVERLYGGERDGFPTWQQDSDTSTYASASRMDAPSIKRLLELARLLGVSPATLHTHRMLDGPYLLHKMQRRAYCPACWLSDESTGRPRAFRRAWAGVFALNCAKHGTPLQWAEPRLSESITAPLNLPALPSGHRDQKVLQLIEDFARALDASLTRNAAWPLSWRGNAHSTRALLIRCVANLGWERGYAPVSSLSPPLSIRAFVCPPRGASEPLVSQRPWESVRALGRPAWRRAALWIAAWYVIPDLPDECRPDSIPMAPFADVDEQWSEIGTPRNLRKRRHMHALLRAMCCSFPVDGDEELS